MTVPPIPWSLVRDTAEADLDPFLPLRLARAHLRLPADFTSDDELIGRMSRSAERLVEDDLGIALVRQELTLKLDRFPCGPINLPRPPLVEVTAVKYYDTAGVQQTLDDSLYYVLLSGATASAPGFIHPVYGSSWPVTQERPQAVSVEYVAGFVAGATPDGATPFSTIPSAVQSAIRMVLAELYEQREVTLTGTIQAQLPLYEKLVGEHRCDWELSFGP